MRVRFKFAIRLCKFAAILGGTKIIFTDVDDNRYTVGFDSKEQALSFYNQVLTDGYADVSNFMGNRWYAGTKPYTSV